MKRVVVSGPLLNKLLNSLNKTLSNMFRDLKGKGRPEEVEKDGKRGIKYLVQVDEVPNADGEFEYMKKGIKNPKTGRVSGDISLTICEVPDKPNKVLVYIEPDDRHWRSSLKEVVSKRPLNKGEVMQFFEDWLDKYDLHIATDEEGRQEIIDEHNLDVDGEEELAAAATDIPSHTTNVVSSTRSRKVFYPRCK